MSTHNIGFYEEISKIILNYHPISSNTHLICSSERRKVYTTLIYLCLSNTSKQMVLSLLFFVSELGCMPAHWAYEIDWLWLRLHRAVADLEKGFCVIYFKISYLIQRQCLDMNRFFLMGCKPQTN